MHDLYYSALLSVWKLCVALQYCRDSFLELSLAKVVIICKHSAIDRQLFKLCIFPPSSYSLLNLTGKSRWLQNHHILFQIWQNEWKRLLLRNISSWGRMKVLINDYYCSPSQAFPQKGSDHLLLYQVHLISFDNFLNFLSDFSCLLRPQGLKKCLQ